MPLHFVRNLICVVLLCVDVLERSQSYDRHLGTEGLGAVRACLSRASHGLSRCSYIEQTMKEWYVSHACSESWYITKHQSSVLWLELIGVGTPQTSLSMLCQ